jgi:hypothetical protein
MRDNSNSTPGHHWPGQHRVCARLPGPVVSLPASARPRRKTSRKLLKDSHLEDFLRRVRLVEGEGGSASRICINCGFQAT